MSFSRVELYSLLHFICDVRELGLVTSLRMR